MIQIQLTGGLPVLSITKRSMKFELSTLVLLAAFAAGSSARAQTGGVDNTNCQTSPENPTAILALVGSAGGTLVAIRSRFRRKP
jgi:XrtJ-associated TM-motif-TM protein